MKITDRAELEKLDNFGVGAPNDAYAQYFKGNSFLKPLTEFGKFPYFLANVTFEPCCRNNWHIHHAKSGGGQILICTTGEGWYQEWGKEPVSLTAGITTEPGNIMLYQGNQVTIFYGTNTWSYTKLGKIRQSTHATPTDPVLCHRSTNNQEKRVPPPKIR